MAEISMTACQFSWEELDAFAIDEKRANDSVMAGAQSNT